MKKISEDENLNEFEKEISKLKEWQDNQYNPGYYYDTGRVPLPIGGLSKYPYLIFILGILTMLPIIFVLIVNRFSLSTLYYVIFPLILSTTLIIGGIQRIIMTKK